MDTEFALTQSILFGEPPIADPESVLLPKNTLLGPNDTRAPTPKQVSLFDGSTLLLQPRVPKRVCVDLQSDTDSYLNMEDLYERVSLSDRLRRSRLVIDAKNNENNAPQPSLMLWTEKYLPQNFLDICSAGNERLYRMIMHWLNKWGTLVFGNPPSDDRSAVDHIGRPLKKILLVHGPLGVGKTAVVHLLARQMGYHVEELNAANSMETVGGIDVNTGRAASVGAVLKLRIKNALTTNTITSNGKPTCLVIDEIDSAFNTGDIVRVLTEVLRADTDNRVNESANAAFFAPKSKKKTKKRFTIKRPIICIANDIYSNTGRSGAANAMEKLRQVSEIISFRKATNGELSGKINASAQKSVKGYLAEISKNENLGLDHKEIQEVFEICEGDIRASINYLQFSCRKLDPDLTGQTTANLSSNKDKAMSWFALVDRLFLRDQRLSKEQNFESIMELVFAGDARTSLHGSLDKVIRGCFNKYLDVVHSQDESAVRPAEISDWLYYYDALTTGVPDASFFSTLASLKFWSLFSDINPQKFRNTESLVPNARGLEFEALETLKKNRAVVQKIFLLLPLELKLSFGGTSANVGYYATQLIPLLYRMFLPDIGSLRAMTSLKPFEQLLMWKLASLAGTLDIQLETQRDVELNTTHLLFSPDWDSIATFSTDARSYQTRRLTNAKRQWLFPLLQQEIEARALQHVHRKRTESPESEDKAKKKKLKLASSVEYFRSQYGDVSAVEAHKRDETARIWVKYHEGFSNAVRKNIGWKDLWAV